MVVANHQNFMDGAVLFGALTRRVSFLVKAEAVKGPLGWLLINVGQYALVRGVPDREPLLKALAQLKAGGAIGIFPEGTRGAGNVETVFPAPAGWRPGPAPPWCRSRSAGPTGRPGRERRRFRPRGARAGRRAVPGASRVAAGRPSPPPPMPSVCTWPPWWPPSTPRSTRLGAGVRSDASRTRTTVSETDLIDASVQCRMSAETAGDGTWSDESEFRGWEDADGDGEDGAATSSRPRRWPSSAGPTSASRRW